MGKDFPYLAQDAAGERTILCDYPIKMFVDAPARVGHVANSENIKPRSTKMTNTSDTDFRDILARNAQEVLHKCGLATDTAVVDEEMIEKLKGFLKDKLSAQDHETLCNILGDAGDAPDDVKAMDGLSRERDRADFYARFPDAARIKIDTSGLPLRPRAPSRTDAADSKSGRGNAAAGAKSFYDMFPEAKRIRQL